MPSGSCHANSSPPLLAEEIMDDGLVGYARLGGLVQSPMEGALAATTPAVGEEVGPSIEYAGIPYWR